MIVYLTLWCNIRELIRASDNNNIWKGNTEVSADYHKSKKYLRHLYFISILFCSTLQLHFISMLNILLFTLLHLLNNRFFGYITQKPLIRL